MKQKLLFIFLLCMAYNINLSAQNNEIQEKVRKQYLDFIKEEGYSPTIDSDGDIAFKIEGRTHYIKVFNESFPQYIIFMTSGFQVGGENGFDKEISLKAVNKVNKQIRSAKLYVTDSSVGVRIEMPFAKTDDFKKVFYKLISYLESGRSQFIDEYNDISKNGGFITSNSNKIEQNFAQNHIVTNQHTMAPDKSCALIIPDGYYSYNFNNTQLLGYIKNDDFPALIVYKENKRNFNNTDIKDLNSYVNTIKKMTEENELLKSLELNPVVGYNFNGYGGVLLKYKFNMDNFGYTYFNYMFETSDSYFQFIVSFVGNAYENKKDVMYQMINSFVLTDQNNSNPPNQANLESKLFTKEDYKKMGSPDSLFIPYGYTIIGENALSSCYNLKYVYIPNSVKIIGEKSFFGCSDMTFVNIPNSVTQIGEQAFFSCRSLESIIIPESVTRIEKSTFGFCIKLNNLNIPNTVTHIGSQAFRNTDIKDLKLPNSITSIDFSAFTECGNLESVIIPSSLVEIGNNVFEKCKKLKAIKVKNTIIYEKMKKEYGRIVKQ